MTRSSVAVTDGPELLSFSEAARLSGQPKAYLRELAESGKLAVRLVPGEGESKMRLTRGALAEAGLFPQPLPTTHDSNDLTELIALVREQSSRIAALEEQRFHLGAQLGVAVERVSTLENQVSILSGTFVPEPPEEIAIPAVVPSSRTAVQEITHAGWQKAGELRGRLSISRLRFPGKSRNGRDYDSEGFGL